MNSIPDQHLVEEQAKKIMDDFMEVLASFEQPEQFGLQRQRQMRTPEPSDTDTRFRQFMFSNAPKVKDDLLIMEKKKW